MSIRLAASVLFASGLIGCGSDQPEARGPRTVLVRTVPQGAQQGSMTLSGEVRARHEVDLSFRVGGKVISRLVDAGVEVKAGTPLARLDPVDLQLAQKAAHAQLAAAESDATTTRAERERYADLLRRKFVSQAAFDARDNAARAAQARLEQARAQAAVSGNQLAYGTLVAGQAGVVTAVLADVGQVVAAGQPIARLARPDEKEVAVAVPESRVGELKAAKELAISLWAEPGLQLQGRLRELAPVADPASRTYAARIQITNPPANVRLGMTARVTVRGDTGGNDGVTVPLAAVFDLGQGAGVWVVTDQRLKRQPVVVRQYREEGVVISDGLRGGEMIVVSGANRLAEGESVQPVVAAESPR